MDKNNFISIYTYLVKKGDFSEFVEGYKPDGVWAHFFQASKDYIKTEFFIDIQNPLRCTTVDYWTSKEAYFDFYKTNNNEIQIIDEKYEAMTDEETLIGYFAKPTESGELK